MTDARLYAAGVGAGAKKSFDRADSGRWRTAILTPEGVELHVEIAERGERAGAFLIDMLFIGAAVTAIFIGTLSLLSVLAEYALAVGLIAFFVVRTFYMIWLDRRPDMVTLSV